MKLSEWQSNQHLTSFAQQLASDSRWQLMLEVLRTESPVSYPDLRAGLPASDDSKVLGRIQGYNFALSNLEKMGLLIQTKKAPEAVFEPEDVHEGGE